MKKLCVIGAFLMAGVSVFAQKGFIRGKITDGESGESLYGATILKQSSVVGAVADFEGNYSLSLDPGMHTIVVTSVSYTTQTIENVEVRPGEVSTVNVAMQSVISELSEVVITASAMRDTESGIMTFQRKSANMLDGISNQTFKRTGDRDLSTALGRVTGVSVQSGKFVYVRGLGDRYTRTTLNGMTIPGLDPDRNDVQIDMFPTSVLENVIIYKTFSPDLPADFTGGIVDIETKKFPDEKTTSVSLGFRFNPDMNLKHSYVTYDGGDTDWLGFDDGTRKLPFHSTVDIPDESKNEPRLETLTRSLNPQLGVKQKRSLLNTTFSFNHGNQLNKNKFTLGYTAIFNYQSNYEHYEDAEFGEYTKNDDLTENALFREEVRTGILSRRNILWSGLLSGALKFDKHKFSASVFRTQNGVSEASDRINSNFDQTQSILYENILTYSQRSVTNGILAGTHQFGKLRLDWKNSLTRARTYDPDFRSIAITLTEPGEPTINRGQGAGIKRFWRDLNEFNENLKLDLTLPYGQSNKLQFGVMGVYKHRDFEVLSYLLDATSGFEVRLEPNYFLRPENIWTAENTEGKIFLEGNYEAPNNYKAKLNVYATYLMTEMSFGKFKAVYGARVEKSDMYYTGTDIFGNQFTNNQTLDELNILPSVNLVYSLTETMNFRASFGQTLARPSFKEKSSAQIFDPITRRFYNGNLDLQQTSINNYDFRWERFSQSGEMMSLSFFFKQFDGHIELVTFDIATNNVRPRNAGNSSVYGAEFEMKKKLDFISPHFSNFSFGMNVTIANSKVDLRSVTVNESGLTEYESRQNNAREEEKIETSRSMGGQSPYLINAFLNYADQESRMNANISYNVQGESLFVIGVGAVPDIYTQPFHSLNFNTYRNFGPGNKHRITVGINNILKAERKDFYKGYGGAEAIYSIFKPGRTFSLTYGLSF